MSIGNDEAVRDGACCGACCGLGQDRGFFGEFGLEIGFRDCDVRGSFVVSFRRVGAAEKTVSWNLQ